MVDFEIRPPVTVAQFTLQCSNYFLMFSKIPSAHTKVTYFPAVQQLPSAHHVINPMLADAVFQTKFLTGSKLSKLSAHFTLKMNKVCPQKSLKTSHFDKNVMHFDCQ